MGTLIWLMNEVLTSQLSSYYPNLNKFINNLSCYYLISLVYSQHLVINMFTIYNFKLRRHALQLNNHTSVIESHVHMLHQKSLLSIISLLSIAIVIKTLLYSNALVCHTPCVLLVY